MSNVGGSGTDRASTSLASEAELANADSAGTLLRQARLAQGIDIASLAGMLKVPVGRLQALESDQFAMLVDRVFTRALAASVCRVLKLDPTEVLQRLPVGPAVQSISQNRGIGTAFRPRDDGYKVSLGSQVSRPALLIGVALLAGAGILVFLPFFQQQATRFRLEFGQTGSRLQASNNSTVVGGLADTVLTNGAVPTAADSQRTQPLPSSGDAGNAVAAGPATTTESTPHQPMPMATGAVASAASSTIDFAARNESWVKVTDATGGVVLNRTLQAGETVQADGPLPLSVIVGRADAVAVTVRGQPYGIVTTTKSNVARFQVK